MDSDFYFGHLEVNNKPLQFVLVTDRYVVRVICMSRFHKYSFMKAGNEWMD